MIITILRAEKTSQVLLLTCPPPKTNDPNLLRSLRGIHVAKRALRAGNVVP